MEKIKTTGFNCHAAAGRSLIPIKDHMVQTQRPTRLWTIDIDSSLRGVQTPTPTPPVLQLDIYQLAAKVERLRFFTDWEAAKASMCPGLWQIPQKLFQGRAFWLWMLFLVRMMGAAYEETADASQALHIGCSQALVATTCTGRWETLGQSISADSPH